MHRLLLLPEILDIEHQSLLPIGDLVERLKAGETEAARLWARRDHQALPEPLPWAPPLRNGHRWVCWGHFVPIFPAEINDCKEYGILHRLLGSSMVR